MITCTFENGNQNSLRHTTVDVLVLKGNQILLAKRSAKVPQGGKWSLAGGFMERNETIRQAARRETLEETGWQVKDLVLLKINDNPNRPKEDRQNISFVFFCQADKQVGQPDWESDELRWFDLDRLPPAEDIAFDHYEQIELYKRYINKPFDLPVLA